TEAVKLALKWAFGHPEVVAVEAESDPDNAASQKVLEKCGFLATGEIDEEGPRFIVYKGANRPVDDCSAPTGVTTETSRQSGTTPEKENAMAIYQLVVDIYKLTKQIPASLF
ncbi:MAG: GNAT family N-acetyltransferase, partial [Lachnospiraceae bacterium]|nr:GNAT family N-acetyltransferase [Lachnospiraceae bacterium]